MITPATSIQIPWHIAQTRKAMMQPVIAWLNWCGDFCRTWSEVYGVNK